MSVSLAILLPVEIWVLVDTSDIITATHARQIEGGKLPRVKKKIRGKCESSTGPSSDSAAAIGFPPSFASLPGLFPLVLDRSHTRRQLGNCFRRNT